MDLAFEDFLVATILAEVFDPEETEDLDILASKIVEGLEKNGLVNINNNLSKPIKKSCLENYTDQKNLKEDSYIEAA